jgi:hypothetical protein
MWIVGVCFGRGDGEPLALRETLQALCVHATAETWSR